MMAISFLNAGLHYDSNVTVDKIPFSMKMRYGRVFCSPCRLDAPNVVTVLPFLSYHFKTEGRFGMIRDVKTMLKVFFVFHKRNRCWKAFHWQQQQHNNTTPTAAAATTSTITTTYL